MGVEVREAHAVVRQRVEVRCPDLTAVGPQVGESHVVTEDDDDIRPFGRVCGGRERGRSDHDDDAEHDQRSGHDAQFPVLFHVYCSFHLELESYFVIYLRYADKIITYAKWIF